MTKILVHFIYKSRHGIYRDYFDCDTDPNEGHHTASTNRDLVTCPDCLAKKPTRIDPDAAPLPADFIRTPDLLTTTKLIQWFKAHPEVLDQAIEAIRPSPPVATSYTAGFAFHGGHTALLLIRKKRGPGSVIGHLNGIGGKIEVGETPVQCQRREFREEAGLDIPEERWTETVILQGHNNGGWRVHFFKCEITDIECAGYRSLTDEDVDLYDMQELLKLDVVSNLQWMIPMQLDRHLDWPITIIERSS